MKRCIKTSRTAILHDVPKENIIRVTMYLYPDIYSNFEQVVASVNYDARKHRYHTDVNPLRQLNGPLSEYGQELESPIKEEYESFIKDCVWLVEELGFHIIKQTRSTDSNKSEYVVMYGLNDIPCGTLIYDLRLSDHPFDAKFPEDLKDEALNYLKLNKILDGTATKAGIDFEVEKITVGDRQLDTWDKAFNRLYLLLKNLRKKVQIRIRERGLTNSN